MHGFAAQPHEQAPQAKEEECRGTGIILLALSWKGPHPREQNRRNRVMMFIYPHSHFCSQLLLTNTKHIRKQAEIVNLAQRNILHTEIAFFFLLKQGSKSASSYIILMRSLIKALPAQSSIFRSLNHSFGYSRLSS